MNKPHPMQPIISNENGAPRFKENKIVNFLLKHGQKTGCGLNELACMSFDTEDREQFAQLIGYSLNGFSELSYVTDDTYSKAIEISKTEQTEEQAEITSLKKTLANIRKHLRITAAEAFRIHPEDLRE